jgi:putative methyltransferase (TIGR04325 family)
MELAPIVLFVYNRPDHARQTLNALALNQLADTSILYIYADGPKKDAGADILINIEETRAVIRSKQWCKEVFIIEADANQGLANSIIKGVTDVVNKHGKVIVLEDDLVTSKYFLQYMNDALSIYETEQGVISIGALNFFATDNEVPDTFFIPIPDCWGWATWKDRWRLFEPNPQLLLNRLREKDLIEKFNLNGAYNFESLLIDQIKGNVNSWAIRWQAVAYLENKLALYPRYSVTKNIGFGGSATHGGKDNYSKKLKFAEKEITIVKQPAVEDPVIINKMIAGYGAVGQPSTTIKLKMAIRGVVKTITPSFLRKLYRRLRSHHLPNSMWQGNYTNWEDAKRSCSGYEDPTILGKTKAAILKVKNGEAAAERDTVLFDKIEYNWPVLSILLKVAAENEGKLSVLDFGGSLGSVYFQSLPMLSSLAHLEWSIIEQPNYVTTGNEFIADDKLRFYFDINTCLKERQPNVLLLSSVLQYLEHPYQQIDQLIKMNFSYIIIDRTAIIDSPNDRLTIQQIPEDIYKASYPAWFFNANNLLNAFAPAYNVIADLEPYPGLTIPLSVQDKGYYKGYILKKRNDTF